MTAYAGGISFAREDVQVGSFTVHRSKYPSDAVSGFRRSWVIISVSCSRERCMAIRAAFVELLGLR